MILGLFIEGDAQNLSEAILWAQVDPETFQRVHFLAPGKPTPKGFSKVNTQIPRLNLVADPKEQDLQPTIEQLHPIAIGHKIKPNS